MKMKRMRLIVSIVISFCLTGVGESLISWQETQSLTSSDFESCACGNNTLIAAGGSSSDPKCYYSTDGGSNWTQKVHSDVAFTSLIFDGQRFVGHDPYNFSVITESMSVSQGDYEYGLSVESLAFGNGIYLAAGGTYDGIRRSVNGLVWTEYQTSQDGNYNTLTYGNGRFLWTNTKGLHSSEDGVTWTNLISESLSRTPVAYGNGRFICPTDDSIVYYSEDGLTWQSAPLAIDPIRQLTYGDGFFFAYSERYTSDTGKVYTSTNGLDWIEQPAADMPDVVNAISYQNGRLLLAGNDGEIKVGYVDIPKAEPVPFSGCNIAAGQLCLQWNSEETVTLYCSTSLMDAVWLPVATVSSNGYNIPADQPNCFFKVETVP